MLWNKVKHHLLLWGMEWQSPYHRVCSSVSAHLRCGHLAVECSNLGSQCEGHFMNSSSWTLGLDHQHLLTMRRDAFISSTSSVISSPECLNLWPLRFRMKMRASGWPATTEILWYTCSTRIFQKGGIYGSVQQLKHAQGNRVCQAPLECPLEVLDFSCMNVSFCAWGFCQKSDSSTHRRWDSRIYILMSSDTDAILGRASVYLHFSDPFPMAPSTYLTDW